MDHSSDSGDEAAKDVEDVAPTDASREGDPLDEAVEALVAADIRPPDSCDSFGDMIASLGKEKDGEPLVDGGGGDIIYDLHEHANAEVDCVVSDAPSAPTDAVLDESIVAPLPAPMPAGGPPAAADVSGNADDVVTYPYPAALRIAFVLPNGGELSFY